MLSCLLSLLTAFGYSRWLESRRGDVGRFRKVELVDSHNVVRARLDLTIVAGREVPQLSIGGPESRPAIVLMTNEKDEGTLFFSSRDREGKVSVGYLLGSDVVDANGRYITDAG